MKKIPILITLSLLTMCVYSQNQKVQFNGTARGEIQSDMLPETDTVNIDQALTGNALVDLRMDIRPADNMRILTEFRFANPMGGFWGQGATIQLRHISLKGVANNIVKYRFGNIDLQMSPYTLYNTYAELSNNESEIFKFTRDINEQENFNNKNSWHQQGFDLSCKLGFEKLIESADLSGFVVRNRSVENNIIPDRLHAGGVSKFNINNKSYFAANYINLFDLPRTVHDTNTSKYQNFVYTGDFKFVFQPLYIFGEAGFSRVLYAVDETTPVDITGEVFEIGLGKKLLQNQIQIDASFRRVSDDFFSAGAQSKRINYTTPPGILNIASANKLTRSIGLLDLVRDKNIYNPTISSALMQYDFALNHVTPYGKATPNRTGATLLVTYTDSTQRYFSTLSGQLLQDTRGEGTEDLRTYTLIEWSGKIAFDKIFDLSKTLSLTAGVQYANSLRDGHQIIDDVDFTSTAFDVGTVIEIMPRFDFLFGTKILVAEGTEYESIRDEYNRIIDYNILHDKNSQQINAIAFRYRFNNNVSFTVQGSQFNYTNTIVNDADYGINQLYILFNMKF